MVPKKLEKNFVKLIEENKLKFYKTAKAILKNDDDTYEALQNALMSMYENLEKLENEKYFATWGTRIVINKCYDMIRKNKKIVSISFDEELETIETAMEDTYDVDSYGLQKILNYLEKELRMIVLLYYYDDISVKDIAEMLKMPEGTVKTKLAKARKILKEKLEKEEI